MNRKEQREAIISAVLVAIALLGFALIVAHHGQVRRYWEAWRWALQVMWR